LGSDGRAGFVRCRIQSVTRSQTRPSGLIGRLTRIETRNVRIRVISRNVSADADNRVEIERLILLVRLLRGTFESAARNSVKRAGRKRACE